MVIKIYEKSKLGSERIITRNTVLTELDLINHL